MPRFAGIPIEEPAEAAPARKPRFAGVPVDHAEPASSPAGDVVKSLGSGAVRGVAETAMLPVTARRLGGQGVDWLIGKADAAVRDVFGLGEPSPEWLAKQERARTENAGARIDEALFGAQDTARDALEAILHKPETTAGEYAETIGEFVPSAIVGPGRAASKVVGDWLIPAIMSETAGQATEGTAAEPWARVAAGGAANLASAGVRAHANAPNRSVAAAAQGMTPSEFSAAEQLQATANRVGVPLSGPEAIQSATGGATKLADLQRVVEGSAAGGTRTARFYADRPDQVAAAAASTFDRIAPQSPNPSTLGPRAAEAATAAIDDVRSTINTATRPAYRAAEGHTLAPADFDPIARDPAFQASLRRLRNDEVLGPTYAGQPDNSVAVIDAVTKDMRDRGVALGNAANPGFSAQKAARYGSGAAEARDIARTPARGGVQEYDDALVMQEQARRQNLDPLEQGPLGRVASSGTTEAAYDAILPRRPLAGGENELVDTITRLSAQDDALPASLVRQSLADRFDRSAGRLVGGENQYGGARFAKEVAGTAQQETDLQAVLDAINVPEARSATDDLIAVLQATGMRKPQGSATEFNRQIGADLGEIPIVAEATSAVRSGGLTIPLAVRDRLQRAWLGRNTETLADLFTASDSVSRIRGVVDRGAERQLPSALARMFMQGGVEVAP